MTKARGVIAPYNPLGSLSRGGETQGILRGGKTVPHDRPRCGCCLAVVRFVKIEGSLQPHFPCRCQVSHRCGRCERCVDCCRRDNTCPRQHAPPPRPGVVGLF